MRKNYKSHFYLNKSISFFAFIMFLSINSKLHAQTTLFFQDFINASIANTANAAITNTDYFTETGEANKFTLIQGGNHNSSFLNINNATAGEFVATDAGSGFIWALNRTSNLASTSPNAVKISFRAKFDVNSTGTTNPRFIFQIGNNFSNSFSTTNLAMKEVNANVFAGFSLKSANSTNGATLFQNDATTQIGSTNIGEAYNEWTIVINKAGASLTYLDPNNEQETVANNSFDLWIGTTKWGNDIAAVTSSVDLNHFKFGSFINGNGGRINVNMDWFKIETISTALPVHFGSIIATQKNGGLNIDWNTKQELNINKFIIEKSSTALEFVEIGAMPAKNISNSLYSFFDANPFAGNNFYRIKAIEKDGSIKYSSVVKIVIGRSNIDFSVNPNPVKDKLVKLQILNFEKGDYVIDVIGSSGSKVYTHRLNHSGGGALSLNIQLPVTIKQGIYSIAIRNTRLNIVKSIFIE